MAAEKQRSDLRTVETKSGHVKLCSEKKSDKGKKVAYELELGKCVRVYPDWMKQVVVFVQKRREEDEQSAFWEM